MERHGFTFTAIQYYLEDIRIESEYEGRQLSRTDIERMYKKGVINEEICRAELSLLGYSELNVDRLFKSI